MALLCLCAEPECWEQTSEYQGSEEPGSQSRSPASLGPGRPRFLWTLHREVWARCRGASCLALFSRFHLSLAASLSPVLQLFSCGLLFTPLEAALGAQLAGRGAPGEPHRDMSLTKRVSSFCVELV